MTFSKRRGRYGIDAPYAPAFMIAGALVCIGLTLLTNVHHLWIAAVILLAFAAVYLHTTLRGKFLVWRRLLDRLDLHGDERILDLGCGRGAVLLMAAEYLPQGRVEGVDIWSSKDQSGNAIGTTRANAAAEGVADRVVLHTADMRKLPFEDACFDAVVSNVAIHNIGTEEGRDQAISEAWRVLRPGGRLLVADISNSRRYVQHLAALGATPSCRNLGWRMWWGSPWASTHLVEAHKPSTP